MSNNPVSGAFYLLKGFNLIRQPGLRSYVVIPLSINIILFLGFTVLLFNSVGEWMGQLLATLPEWLQWLDWLIWILLGASIMVFAYFSFTIVANIISAPFNGVLSEAVEKHLGNTLDQGDSPWHSFISDLGPTFREEFLKLFYTITRSVPFLVLLLVPGVNFIASAAWLLFGAWMLALQYTDYPFSNHKIYFKQHRATVVQRRWLVLGFGGAVMVGSMIPVLNLFVIPSAVAGATALYLDHFKNRE